MEHAKPRLPHEPEVQRRYIRVADEDLGIVREDLRFEVRQHANRAVAASAADDRLDARVQPHAHEVRRAAFVLVPLKAPELRDIRIEDYLVAGTLERIDAAHEWAGSGRVRRGYNPDCFTFRNEIGRASCRERV